MQEKALELLRDHSPYGAALENHCTRVAQFAMAIADVRTTQIDEDLVFTAAWLHDIGLCVRDPSEPNYLKRGLKLAKPYVEKWGLRDEQLRAFEHMMLYNHSLTPIDGIDGCGEILRNAVQIEHSLGRVSHGVPQNVRERVFEENPRLNFNQVLIDFFKTSMKEGGPVELFKVFLPAGLSALRFRRA